MGRTLGFVLLGASIVIAGIAGAWLFTNEGLSQSAAILGFGLISLFLVLPLAGVGVFTLVQGQGEAKQLARAKQQRELLSIIKSRGKVDIADVAIEQNLSRERLQEMIHDLVGKGLYSGYINWDQGTLYSSEASKLRELTKCNNCGGQLTIAGKGVIKCPYCGTEYFL